MRIKRVRKPSGRGYAYYRRRDGGLTPLPDLPENAPEFVAAYAEAEAADRPTQAPRTHPRALATLVDRYLDGPAFAALAPTTRETRRRILLKIAAGKAADAPVTGLCARHIEADLAGLTPAMAANRLKAWRAALAHAVRPLGWIPASPAAAVRVAKPRHQPHRRWSAEAVAAFRAAWPLGAQQRAAFELAYHHAPRRADLARLSRRDVAAGRIAWRQSKTGDRTVERALHPDAAAALAALLAERPGLFTFLETAQGRARSVKALGEWFRAACAKAGVAGLSLHGLRHSLASDAAEGGASDRDIQALLGHRTSAEARVYTQQAEALKLAERGAQAAGRNRNLETGPVQSGNHKAK